MAHELGHMSDVRPARLTPPGGVLKALARGKHEPSKNLERFLRGTRFTLHALSTPTPSLPLPGLTPIIAKVGMGRPCQGVRWRRAATVGAPATSLQNPRR
eukprot:16416937-Heterocapsa_arctica.AAC.1